MRINHNISALKANNQLKKTNNKLDSSLEKLSSGYRINSAADDSAGLAISEKMRTQISGLDQASRNASDGISVIQTAEGALVEVEAMLQRMRELSVQSANGTYTSDDRAAIQKEIDQLSEEINRISKTTEFNSMTLLDGNIDRKSYSNNSNVKLVSLSDTVQTGEYGVKITQDARQAVVVGKGTTFTGASTAYKITDAQAGSININGESVKIEKDDTMDEVFEKIRTVCDKVNVNVFATANGSNPSTTEHLDMAGYTSKTLEGGDQLVFSSEEYGSDQKIKIFCDKPGLCDLLGLTTKGVSAQGYDAKAELEIASQHSNFENTATLSVKGNKVAVTDSNSFSMVFEVQPGTIGSAFTDTEITDTAADASTSYPPHTIKVGGQWVTITQDARQAVIKGNTTTFTGAATATNATAAATINITSNTGTATPIMVNPGDSLDSIWTAIQSGCSSVGVSAVAIAADAVPDLEDPVPATTIAGYTAETSFEGGDRLLFATNDYGSTANVTITCSDANLSALLGLTSATGGVSAQGVNAKASIADPGSTATVATNGNVVTVTEGAITTSDTLTNGYVGTAFTDTTVISPTAAAVASSLESAGKDILVSVLDAGPMDLQIGANAGQTMTVRIPKVTTATLGIDKVNVGTADGAQEAVDLLDTAVNTVSMIRSKLGAYQNRLEHSISNLDTTSENMTESLSRISDVDMAEEMASYTQMNVLAQAGTSMLAQANQRPQTILTLLQS